MAGQELNKPIVITYVKYTNSGTTYEEYFINKQRKDVERHVFTRGINSHLITLRQWNATITSEIK